MRFLGSVFNNGVALRQNGGHHDIHGCAYRYHVQIDVGPGQTSPGDCGVDVAALGGDAGPQRGKSLYVLVNGADAAEVAAAGHGHLRLAEAAQQSADEVIGGPQLPAEFIGGTGSMDMAAVDLHRMAVDGADGSAQLLQNLQNGGNVGDLGNIFDTANAVYQNGGGNDGDSGIFSAADLYLAEKGLAAVYDIFCQNYDLISR